MSLMTGLPLAELKATCAHEYSHAWVGENVPKERRARLGRDAEEGFCELVAYLLMDSQGKKGKKNSFCKTITPAARLTCSLRRKNVTASIRSWIG